MPALPHLLSLAIAAIAVIALLRALYRWRPIDPPPADYGVRPRALVAGAVVSVALAIGSEAMSAPVGMALRDGGLWLAGILAVLAAAGWAERAPETLGLRRRLLTRDLPALAALCALIGTGAIAVLHGRSPFAAAALGAGAGLIAGVVPALHAAARLRAGRDGGGLAGTLGFAVLLALALGGALRHVG